MTALGRFSLFFILVCVFNVTRVTSSSISAALEKQVQANQTLGDRRSELWSSADRFDSDKSCSINGTCNARTTEGVHESLVVKRAVHATRRKSRKALRNRRRQHYQKPQKRKSCPTKTECVIKSKAEDMFGDEVDVHPFVSIGKLNFDQVFYETFCDMEGCKCDGMKNKYFKSSCQTTYSLSYGRIIKGGEIGWSLIKLRSGCACVIEEKTKSLLAHNDDI